VGWPTVAHLNVRSIIFNVMRKKLLYNFFYKRYTRNSVVYFIRPIVCEFFVFIAVFLFLVFLRENTAMNL